MTMARTRSTAPERRVQLVEAALTEFAMGGLHGTSTEAIARRAGISHAYLFRLVPTKKQLFIDCALLCFRRVEATFQAAAVGVDADQRQESMGQA
jgi:AcrR family transcriptional regulator